MYIYMFKNEMFFCMAILNIYIKIHQSFSLIIDHETMRDDQNEVYTCPCRCLYTRVNHTAVEFYRYKKENSLMLQNTIFAL